MDNDIVKIEATKVESSNVASVGYHNDRNILSIEMLNGHVYYYMDIPRAHFNIMMRYNKEGVHISSIGSYLRLFIYGNYRYTRVN